MIKDKPTIDRILVRMPNWLGDVVMALPALESVRDNFPDSKITVLTRPWVLPILQEHPAVDQVLPLKTGKGYPTDLLEVLRSAARVRRMGFDLAVLFQNAFEAALIARLGGVPLRVGYNTDGRGLLLSHPIERDKDVLRGHQVEYYLSLLRAMTWKAESKDPRLFVGNKSAGEAKAVLQSAGFRQNDFILGLAPGAIYGPAKRWGPDRFALVGDRAVEEWDAKVLLLGSAAERDIGAAVALAMKSPALNLCGRTSLGMAAALILLCGAFVTNDSGLMHVAAALDVPMVAVFGSTDPVATGPRSGKARVVRHPMACSPCLEPSCIKGYSCLLSVEPEEVWMELEQLRGELP